uniref:Uncharacterized protein n=1 Tax=Candidatus Kentrum eta TaxID=2126337 RepID=A0A450VI89_9GAMM|nr:MAG: hypothetical protein BECKH772B_GA0070898_104312 [Candidatus Kentron sp. H]VFK04552.1 MAG: hypothetical protein BECKH772A_GA0070896_104292 [Candidatus Kentron sp. H]VFK07999.1 MAG: hypothetical protein BECKH772C_GA0070978_104762 [Candidatus Kentron sp. H]
MVKIPAAPSLSKGISAGRSGNACRGLDEEDAVSIIVNGFCKEVFRELPMEFAVEARKLLSLSLEGAVG